MSGIVGCGGSGPETLCVIHSDERPSCMFIGLPRGTAVALMTFASVGVSMRRALALRHGSLGVMRRGRGPRAGRQQLPVQGLGGLTFGTSSFLPKTATAPAPSAASSRSASHPTSRRSARSVGCRTSSRRRLRPAGVHACRVQPVGVVLGRRRAVHRIAAAQAVRPCAEATAGHRADARQPLGPRRSVRSVRECRAPVRRTRKRAGARLAGSACCLEHGPLSSVDVGYRYKKITAGRHLVARSTPATRIQINEARFGIGVRF